MTWDPTLRARPTIYNGIRMRSRLEAGYAAWLDRHNFTWEYEPCAFADDTGAQYLPDFLLKSVPILAQPEPANVYVEVKPHGWHEATSEADPAEAYVSLMERMSMIFRSEPDALPIVQVSRSSYDNKYAAAVAVVPSGDEDEPVAACMVSWCRLRDGGLGLASPLDPSDGPWFGEWWKGLVV
jgi:hypothetical protein